MASTVEAKSQRALVLGFGATGMAIGQALVGNGFRVTGVARSLRLAHDAAAIPVDLVQGDLTFPESLAAAGWPHGVVIVAAATKPSDPQRNPWALYVEGHRALAAWLERQTPAPERVIVLSNTSVYGPVSVLPSGVIDETSPLDARPKPDRTRGGDATRENESIVSEEVWRASALPWILVRVPGIRKEGSRDYEAMISRPEWRPPVADRTYQTIRLEALARVVAFLARHGQPRSVYNATPPVINSAVRRARAVAALLGREFAWPPEADLSKHRLIIPEALRRLGYSLTEDDG